MATSLSRMRLLRAVASTLALAALAPLPCRGDAALPQVARLLVELCPAQIDAGELAAQLRIEILAAGVVDVEEVRADAQAESRLLKRGDLDVATLHLRFPGCREGSPRLSLRLANRTSGAQFEQTLDLADLPPGTRPRTIALALVELLRAHWAALAAPPGSPPPGRNPPHAAAARDRPASPAPGQTPDPPRAVAVVDRRPRLEWAGGAQLYPSAHAGASTSALTISPALPRRFRVHLGAAGSSGIDDRGVKLVQVAGRVGLGITGGGELMVDVGLLTDVGWGSVRGRNIQGANGLVVQSLVQAVLRSEVWSGVETFVGLYTGYVLRPLAPTTVGEEGQARRHGFHGTLIGITVGISSLL